jgi:hypothetical protein
MALSIPQIHEALEQVLVSCELAQAEYTPMAMRSALIDLGYSSDADQIVAFVAAGGFTYCMDPSVSATHYDPNNREAVNGMVTDYPGPDACFWGPDQLASRLRSLSNWTPQYRAR